MSGAYALSSRNLSLSGSTSTIAYVTNQSLAMTYTTPQTSVSPYTYTIGMTVKNGAALATSVWQIDLEVPSDASSISCPRTVTCTLNGTTLTVLSNTSGTIAPGGNTQVSFTYKTTTNGAIFQGITTYANHPAALATMPGLTVNASAGTVRKSGSSYSAPLTVTVTNNSGKPITGWQAVISPFSRTYTLTGVTTGVSSVRSSTLTLTGSNELATGGSYQFSATVRLGGSTTWRVTSATIRGDS